MKPSALLSSRSALMMFLWMASITITTYCFATAFSSTSQMISTTNKFIIGNNNDKLLLFLHQHHRAKKIVRPSSNVSRQPQRIIIFPSTTRLHAAENNGNNNIDPSRIVTNDLGLDIVRGTGIDNADEISDQTWEEIEGSAPSKLMIVKNVSLCCCMLLAVFWDVNIIIIIYFFYSILVSYITVHY